MFFLGKNVICLLRLKKGYSLLFVSFVATLLLSLLFYLLPNRELLTSWNHSIAQTTLAGISIGKRIMNFYLFYVIVIPFLMFFNLQLYSWLYVNRPVFISSLIRTHVAFLFSIIVCWTAGINNQFLLLLIACLLLIICIGALDKQQRLNFEDISFILITFISLTATLNILCSIRTRYIIALSLFVMLLYTFILIKVGIERKNIFNSFSFTMMWAPVVFGGCLEVLYFRLEKQMSTPSDLRVIFTILLIVLFFIISIFKFSLKYNKFIMLGYCGAISSLVVISRMQFDYHITCNCFDYAWLFEAGNGTVALDTLLHGKIPILDYFPAHALYDVASRLLYCFSHNDINGVFVDPYIWIYTLIGKIILFLLLKELFGKEMGVLITVFFPFSISAVKTYGICFAVILTLVIIIKNKKLSNFLVFWLSCLLCAFFIYDEGMSLGLGCIFSFILISLIEKDYKNIKAFLCSGFAVALCVLTIMFVYSFYQKFDLVMRVKEWLSVSIASNDVVATISYGDPNKIAFFVSYLLIPLTAVSLLFVTLFIYYSKRKYSDVASLVLAFSIAQIFYFPRTIAFHNLAICSGVDGVLLNFTHWTIALAVLLISCCYKLDYEKKCFNFLFSFFIVVVVIEGGIVTQVLPKINSCLASAPVEITRKWNIKKDLSQLKGRKRIVFDQKTEELVNKFKKVFDCLLNDDETFIDYANITSMYAFTKRERPCYVAQTPSLLSDLYSQERYLEEIKSFKCPLAIVGATSHSYTQDMIGVRHNVRYYKIAEHIWSNYRPLMELGDFAIWCQKDKWECFQAKVNVLQKMVNDIKLIDYGYDVILAETDNDKKDAINFHSYDLQRLPFIWGNYDQKKCWEKNSEISLEKKDGKWCFAGSHKLMNDGKGKNIEIYIKNQNQNQNHILATIFLQDNNISKSKLQYVLVVYPGEQRYIIRPSQDYLWYAFNINCLWLDNNSDCVIDKARIISCD